jgi:hypothetical protein
VTVIPLCPLFVRKNGEELSNACLSTKEAGHLSKRQEENVMLEGLEGVAWHTLKHAYGDASDVPEAGIVASSARSEQFPV